MNLDDGQNHEDELRAALRHRADDVDVTTDFAPGAITRQRRDHRSRVALAGVACLAAVAVAVPMLWGAARPQIVPGPALPTISSSTNPPSTPARSTTPPSPSTNPSTPPSTTGSRPPSPSAASNGAPASPESTKSTGSTASPPSLPSEGAGVAYAVDNVLRVGPAAITLPRGATVERFARLQDGAVVVSWNRSGTTRTQVLTAKGRELAVLGNSLWVVSRDRARVAWSDGQVAKVLDGAGNVVTTRRTPLQPLDIVGDHLYLVSAGDQVVVDDPQEWNFVTGKTRTLPKDLAAVSPSRERGVVVYPQGLDSQNVCWALVDLTSKSFTRLLEKCPSPFVPRGFSANGTYLTGDTGVDGGFFSEFVVVRADTGRQVFGATTNSLHEGSGWSMHLDADERTLWLSANTSAPRFPAGTNSVQRCTIGEGCSRVTPSLKTSGSQPRYVVESRSIN